ncbi:hypothetical protein LB579_33615, partial [Mesorhizobium sp. BR1-1-7]|uniref:hypothetical protein n=1 Tax=Mesorhizobium sp. BR1-1-7 TaxID=2876647 RepID=UPI001CCA0F04
MTLGSSPTPAQVVAELGLTFPYTFPDARTRWLADVGTSDSITFPTSFASKTALKIPHISGPTGVSTSHTVTGVNFGPVYTNRRLLVYVIAHGKNSGISTPTDVTITNFTVGGATGAPGPLTFWYFTGEDSSTIFSGVQR